MAIGGAVVSTWTFDAEGIMKNGKRERRGRRQNLNLAMWSMMSATRRRSALGVDVAAGFFSRRRTAEAAGQAANLPNCGRE